jgi:hypothetical protein
MRLWRLWIKLLFVVAAVALIGVWVLHNARIHCPVHEGTPEEFWSLTCGINLDGADGPRRMGGMYPPQGKWGIYYVQGYHDQFLHRVRLSELAPSVPAMVRVLEEKVEAGSAGPFHAGMLDRWNREDGEPRDIERLLRCRSEAYLAFLKDYDADIHAYRLENERGFSVRWQRAERFWLTLLFEFVWLAGVIVFAAIPWLRRAGRLGWAIHLALVPPLLFLPHFLGYAPYTFTSLFPDGGVAYPYAIRVFGALPLPWTDLDTWLMDRAPRWFQPFAQQAGMPLAMTGMGGIGPVSICGLGLLIGGFVYGGCFLLLRRHRES